MGILLSLLPLFTSVQLVMVTFRDDFREEL
jgi:hypothetical protein